MLTIYMPPSSPLTPMIVLGLAIFILLLMDACIGFGLSYNLEAPHMFLPIHIRLCLIYHVL